MAENLLPQYPFDGQIFLDHARQTRWVYNKAFDLWERQGIAEPPAVATAESAGYLSNLDKAFIDTIQTDTPGSFSIIVDPKAGLVGIGEDGLISGNITLVSDSLDITCSVFTPAGKTVDTENCSPAKAKLIPDGPTPPALNFSLGQNFLNSLAIDLPGAKGDTGPKGLTGEPGRHGYDYLGPPGVEGRVGLNGTTKYTLNGILYNDLPDELSEEAIVDINLLTVEGGGPNLVFTKSMLNVQHGAASRIAANYLQRYLEYPSDTGNCSQVKLTDWVLKQPAGDFTNLDLNLLRLPTGSKDSAELPVQFDSSLMLADYVKAVADAYQANLQKIDGELGKRARAYIEEIDSQARAILANLAQRLSDAEFSLPAQDFCLTLSSNDTPTVFPPTPAASPKPTPTPVTPSPVPPVIPDPYHPTPVIPPVVDPPVPTLVQPTPWQPPDPPVNPTPVFPPSPTPIPVVPPPYNPTPTPTPLTPTPTGDPPPDPPSPRGMGNGIAPVMQKSSNNGEIFGSPRIRNNRNIKTITHNNKSWFYHT